MKVSADEEFKALPDDRAIVLDNVTCVYCGAALVPEHTTKEHVAGKNFVPTGKLYQSWNLIVRACLPCNNLKSDLEDDIGAISMAPNAAGRYAIDDPVLKAAAARKAARSMSRKTRKLVADSSERINIQLPFGPGGLINADFTAPPQLDAERLFHLASLQVGAFFYWVTYDKETKTGRFWLEGCYLIEYAIRSDWGNARLMGFADTVLKWEPRVIGVTSEGFFKVIIRRHPDPMTALWAWALEWNHNYRIVGFFGDRAEEQRIADLLPPLEVMSVFQTPNGENFRIRKDVPLVEDHDALFAWDHPAEVGGT